jgi:hypothetical protein
MRRVSKPIKTKEEKVVERIGVLLSDLTLDLEKVGYYMAKNLPYMLFSRTLEVLESANFQKPVIDEIRETRGDWYDDRLTKKSKHTS